MVGTVRAARHDGRWAFALTAAAFASGLALGASVVFVGLGLLGAWAHTRALVVAAVAIAAAAILSDASGLRVRPQIPFQVPERWRRRMPLPRALLLYGVLLGTGLTTFVPASAAWALPALSLALGDVPGSFAIALGFATARPAGAAAAHRRLAAPGARGRRGAGGGHGGRSGRRPERRSSRPRLAAPRRERLSLAQRHPHAAARKRSGHRRRARGLACRPRRHRGGARHARAGAPADAAGRPEARRLRSLARLARRPRDPGPAAQRPHS